MVFIYSLTPYIHQFLLLSPLETNCLLLNIIVLFYIRLRNPLFVSFLYFLNTTYFLVCFPAGFSHSFANTRHQFLFSSSLLFFSLTRGLDSYVFFYLRCPIQESQILFHILLEVVGERGPLNQPVQSFHQWKYPRLSVSNEEQLRCTINCSEMTGVIFICKFHSIIT